MVCLGAVLVHNQGRHALDLGRQARALALTDMLDQACRAYETDMGEYPPGYGWGSAQLVTALATPCLPYVEFRSDMLLWGHVRNPAAPDDILHYRAPGQHNPRSFDLWGEGIDNW